MSAVPPLVPPEASPPELTARALVTGTLLGVVFGASSLYLTLKVGLTVSASIPVAVLSVALWRAWAALGGRDATVLEHNVAQTAGSAGESLAFGIGITMPAILILGFDLELWRVTLVALLGGALGILMMIPLRRALVVQQHHVLAYPEGRACAEVLRTAAGGDADAADARPMLLGFGVGLAYKVLGSALKLWKEVPGVVLGPPLAGGTIAAEISPELLGVGWVIGPRVAGTMAAGGALSSLLLVPLVRFVGGGLATPLAPGTTPIGTMSPAEIRNAYVLYVGAGAVTAGGLIGLARTLPMVWGAFRAGLGDVAAGARAGATRVRTERDLSMRVVVAGVAALVLAIAAAPPLHMNALGAVLIVAFGFLFVTVSSRLTGEIGSSSNPISGMTIATLLLTCLVFLAVGWTGGTYYVTALSVGAIVCVASSNAGTTSQDLKTGFLLGATPWRQQVAILVGASASALALGPILLALDRTATVYVPAEADLVAPRAVLADAPTDTLHGPQAAADPATYRVWHRLDPAGGAARKYLVRDDGRAVWLVDPGINGTVTERPDGTHVHKFDAPKATLVSYVIKGILDRRLPWEWVLFGVVLAAAVELCGVAALPFAVGVYLPIAVSVPIFVGGVLRALVDRGHADDAEAGGRGVLLASGYIAGGSIAGILVAFVAAGLPDVDAALTAWASAHDPFAAGPWSDALALLPFAALAALLAATGRRATAPVAPRGSG